MVKDSTRERYERKGLEPFMDFLLSKGNRLQDEFECDPYLRHPDGSRIDSDICALILADYFCSLHDVNINPSTYSQALQHDWRLASRSLSPFKREIVGAVIRSKTAAERRNAGRARTMNSTEPATTEMCSLAVDKFFPPELNLLSRDKPVSCKTADQAAAACMAVTLFLFSILRLSNQTTQITAAQAKRRAEYRANIQESRGLSVDLDQIERELRQDNALLEQDVIFGRIDRLTNTNNPGWHDQIIWESPRAVARKLETTEAAWLDDIQLILERPQFQYRFVGILSPCTKQHQMGDRPIRLLIDAEKHTMHADVLRMMLSWTLFAKHQRPDDHFWSRPYADLKRFAERYCIPLSRIAEITKIIFVLFGKASELARSNAWKYGGATLLASGQTRNNLSAQLDTTPPDDAQAQSDPANRELARQALGHSSSNSTGHYINDILGGLGTLPDTSSEQAARNTTRSALSSTLFRNAFTRRDNNSSQEPRLPNRPTTTTTTAPTTTTTTTAQVSGTPPTTRSISQSIADKAPLRSRAESAKPKRSRLQGSTARHQPIDEQGTGGDPVHRPNQGSQGSGPSSISK